MKNEDMKIKDMVLLALWVVLTVTYLVNIIKQGTGFLSAYENIVWIVLIVILTIVNVAGFAKRNKE